MQTKPLSVEDRLAIHELLARYAWTFDMGDIEGFVAQTMQCCAKTLLKSQIDGSAKVTFAKWRNSFSLDQASRDGSTMSATS